MTIPFGVPHYSLGAGLLSIALLSCIGNVASEIRSFKGRIKAASNVIHYSEGFLVAPGYVDLSGLLFTTIDDEEFDDDSEDDEDDGGGRRLKDDGNDDIAADLPGSTIDIVLFHEPADCANSRSGCDWSKLGVGAVNEIGTRWCCSQDAIDGNFCEGGEGQFGRLIVNASAFDGQHRFIKVPPSGDLETTVKYPKLEEKDESGTYILIVANCNDEGRNVMVDGQYTWKSVHGYLPGDRFQEMHYFITLAFVYFILFCWYGISMKIHDESTIPIQKWVLTTIGMGFLESFFKTGDLFVWNEDGTRFWFAMYTGVIVGVMKTGISRCLILMVSLGWGVVRDTLGEKMRLITALGIFYVATAASRDIVLIFGITENEELSIKEDGKLYDTYEILTLIVAAADVTFILWIFEAMNGTMQYLENMNQSMKLKRYLRLRCIILLSILYAIIWFVFGLVDTYMDTAMMEKQDRWGITVAWEINYLFVLISVAVLWRPNPSAKDYAFVMELPSLGGEDGDEHGIEFTETIPSAVDDEKEEVEQDVYHDDAVSDISAGEKMNRLKLDDA